MIETVFVLWHDYERPDQEENIKMLGVYSDKVKAEQAKSKAITKPGFIDHPDGFHIDEYRIDEPHWTEGFVTLRNLKPLTRRGSSA
jgi:hypothetical protein